MSFLKAGEVFYIKINKETTTKGNTQALTGCWLKKKKMPLIHSWNNWEILNMDWMLYEILELLLIFLSGLMVLRLWENVIILRT